MHRRVRHNILIAGIVCLLALSSAKADTLNVYAAASLTDVVDELVATFEETNGADTQGIYASSAALARQIDTGAPAHIYISANTAWMDYLSEQNLIDKNSRQNVARNTLVTIAHKDKDMNTPISEQKNIRVVIGEPSSVPVGIYAVQAMKAMGDYPHVKDNLLYADSARSVLTWVERNEVDFGIVYATDARVSKDIKQIAAFPTHAYDPILYPAAATTTPHPDAQAFLDLITSDTGQAIFARFGFLSVDDPDSTPSSEPSTLSQ